MPDAALVGDETGLGVSARSVSRGAEAQTAGSTTPTYTAVKTYPSETSAEPHRKGRELAVPAVGPIADFRAELRRLVRAADVSAEGQETAVFRWSEG